MKRISKKLREHLAAILIIVICVVSATLAQAGTTSYSYDPIGRLISATDASGVTTDYRYDAAGNLLSVSRRALPTPTIDSFAPVSGQIGDQVLIRGSNFSVSAAQNQVRFNGVAATVATATATALSAVVPAGASTGSITVTTPNGSATSTLPFTVVVPQPPQITGLSPLIASPGSTVTIAGQNFSTVLTRNQAKVNVASATVSAASATSLSFVVPNSSGGKVAITTPGGDATSSDDLFVVPPPYLVTDVGSTRRITINAPSVAVPIAANKVGLLLFDSPSSSTIFKLRVANSTLGDGTVRVLKPDGTLLTSSTFAFQGGVITLPALPDSGSYSVLIIPRTATGGSVNVSIGQDIEGSLVLGEARSLSFMAAGQAARLTFQADAGTIVTTEVSSVAMSPQQTGFLALRGAGGAGGFTASYGSSGVFIRSSPLPVTGAHAVELIPDGFSVGSLNLKVSRIVDIDAGVLASSDSKLITIVDRGQQARFVFAGTAGLQSSIAFSGISLTGGGAVASVFRPDGTSLASAFLTGSNVVLRLPSLPVNGNYSVVVVPNNFGTGSFTARFTSFSDVDAGVIAVGETKDIAISVAGQLARLTFAGTSGDRLGLNFSAVTFLGGGSVTVRRRDGSAIVSSVSFPVTGGVVVLPTLTTTGTYTIEVQPANGGTGAAKLSLGVIGTVDGGAIAVGERKTVSMSFGGQTGKLTFTATAGQQLGLSLSDSTLTSGGTYTITRPDGPLLQGGVTITSGRIDRLSVIPTTGTYTITVVPANNGTGSVTFKLWSDVNGGSIAPTETKTLTFTDGGQQAKLTFAATAGQQLGLSLSGSTLTSGGTYTITRPDGPLLQGGVTIASGRIDRLSVIPTTGTYTITVVPANNGTGSVTFKLWSDVNGGSIAPAETKTLTFTDGGQQAKLTFAATAGQQLGLSLSGSTLTSGGTYTITRPDGPFLQGSVSITNGRLDRLSVIPTTGTYTITVVPSNNGTGSAEFTLWQDAVAALAVGQPTDVTLAFAGQQSRLQFDGTAGQLLSISLSAVAIPPGGTMQVLSPSGAALVSTTSFGAGGLNVNIPALTSTGLHTVVIVPNSNGTGTFTTTLNAR